MENTSKTNRKPVRRKTEDMAKNEGQPSVKGTLEAQPEIKKEKKSNRGRPSRTIQVPINRQTQSILQTCVTLGQATSVEAAAAKLLSRSAEDLQVTISGQIAGNFFRKS